MGGGTVGGNIILIAPIPCCVKGLVFIDHHGRNKTDSGAGQFIEKIEVEMGKSESKSILIRPTEHLNTQPILECLNYNLDFLPKRANKSDLLFELSSADYLVWQNSPLREEWVFRIEIVR